MKRYDPDKRTILVIIQLIIPYLFYRDRHKKSFLRLKIVLRTVRTSNFNEISCTIQYYTGPTTYVRILIVINLCSVNYFFRTLPYGIVPVRSCTVAGNRFFPGLFLQFLYAKIEKKRILYVPVH